MKQEITDGLVMSDIYKKTQLDIQEISKIKNVFPMIDKLAAAKANPPKKMMQGSVELPHMSLSLVTFFTKIFLKIANWLKPGIIQNLTNTSTSIEAKLVPVPRHQSGQISKAKSSVGHDPASEPVVRPAKAILESKATHVAPTSGTRTASQLNANVIGSFIEKDHSSNFMTRNRVYANGLAATLWSQSKPSSLESTIVLDHPSTQDVGGALDSSRLLK